MRILITGAGQGLGSWIARLALERGHNVIATVHSLSHVCEETQALCAAFPVQFRLLKMDVTSDREVAEVEALLRAEQPQLDAIVNNAGIMIERDHTIEELDLDAVIRSFQVNTVGPMRVVQKFLPLLSAGTRSCIVNISSEAGTIINAFPTNYAYSMSKCALNMFSERLREYLKERDILVYAVHPGWMRTNMGGCDAPADPADIANGILDILERKKKIYSKIAFIDSTGRPMPL